jgi:hypothetical protein
MLPSFNPCVDPEGIGKTDGTALAVVHLRAAPLLLAVTIALMAGFPASAQKVHLSRTVPGGMPGETNFITAITLLTNGVQVTWDGPPGYYRLYESPSTNDPAWRALTRHNDWLRTATVPARYSNAFFQVTGPTARYAGSETCAGCHAPVLKTQIHTLHASAFTNALFAADGGQTNASCLACHTVGFDLPTGFVTESQTPHLTGVQCENCHGPAAQHAANPGDPLVVPRAELAAQVCGGCHNDPRHPTFDEWSASGHALPVVEDMNPAGRIKNCGRCHSGSVRVSLLDKTPLPKGDADMGIVCATCHNPHQTNSNPAQLRNPIASTEDYFMPTNGVFAKLYNPDIGICAQCHNHAGASWTNNACEPHHSLQYNMLLGSVGELASGLPPYQPGTHALSITNQCVGCHMQTTPFTSQAQPAVTGHSFAVGTNYTLCLKCHSEPALLVTFATNDIASQVQALESILDYWAANNAPTSLAKYGSLAWEYTTAGSLNPGRLGPAASEQAQIPENIRKARFNLYLVQNDGSFGVHNPYYAITLLNAAAEWVYGEITP